jgi:hypothetical protein
MKAVAAQNARVKDPVYHVVLSWPSGESPTDEQAFQCGRHAVRAVGMEGHQYVFAVHRDTAHAHLHIAVNRVHPDTFAAVYPDRDYFKLDRAMRELELLHGWRHDKGPYAVFERGGQPGIDWASQAADTKGKRPTRAADMERHADVESLFSYVRGAPREAVLQELRDEGADWAAIHDVLASFGLEIRLKGQGLAVYDLAGDTEVPVKASDMHESLSKPRLVARLGAYVPPAKAAKRQPVSRYDKFRSSKRDPVKREQRRQERADARRGLRERYEAYRSAFVYRRLDALEVKRRYAELRDGARRRRAEVSATVRDSAARKALYSVIAFETLRARERLRSGIKVERDGLRNAPGNRRLSFREWVAVQAAAGDAAAISQLRGWAYAEGREARQFNAIIGDQDLNGFRGDEALDPVARDFGKTLTYAVRRNGTVVYRNATGKEAFVDHGQCIQVLPAALADHDAVDAAHRLAREKYGSSMQITGGDDFKRAVQGSAMAASSPDIERSPDQVPTSPEAGRVGTATRRRRRLG